MKPPLINQNPPSRKAPVNQIKPLDIYPITWCDCQHMYALHWLARYTSQCGSHNPSCSFGRVRCRINTLLSNPLVIWHVLRRCTGLILGWLVLCLVGRRVFFIVNAVLPPLLLRSSFSLMARTFLALVSRTVPFFLSPPLVAGQFRICGFLVKCIFSVVGGFCNIYSVHCVKPLVMSPWCFFLSLSAPLDMVLWSQ